MSDQSRELRAEQLCIMCGAPEHVVRRDGKYWITLRWCGEKVLVLCSACYHGKYGREALQLASIELFSHGIFSLEVKVEDITVTAWHSKKKPKKTPQ